MSRHSCEQDRMSAVRRSRSTHGASSSEPERDPRSEDEPESESEPRRPRRLRGLGLLRGLVVAESHADRVPDVISRAEDAGLLILRSGSRAIRLAPPLIISDKEISEGTRILSTIMKSVLNK